MMCNCVLSHSTQVRTRPLERHDQKLSYSNVIFLGDGVVL